MSSSRYPLLDISDDSESSVTQSEGEDQITVSNKQSALKTKRKTPAKTHNLRKRKQADPSSDGADEDEDDIVVTVSKK